MTGMPRILTVTAIAGFFIVAFLGLVLGSTPSRVPPPTREDQCERLATITDPKAVVLEPQNTWSNWGYLIVGVLIVYRSRNLLGAFVGLNLAFEFLFSSLYHSKLSEGFQFIDVAWIYVLILSLIACAIQCVVGILHDWARETERPVFSNPGFLVGLAIALSTIGLGILIKALGPDSTFMTIFLVGLLGFVLAFKYLWKLLHTLIPSIIPDLPLPEWKGVDTFDIILIVIFGFFAILFRFSDGPKPALLNLCDPTGAVQAHAVWHIASALLALATYDFFGHFYPGQGRIFANWLADD